MSAAPWRHNVVDLVPSTMHATSVAEMDLGLRSCQLGCDASKSEPCRGRMNCSDTGGIDLAIQDCTLLRGNQEVRLRGCEKWRTPDTRTIPRLSPTSRVGEESPPSEASRSQSAPPNPRPKASHAHCCPATLPKPKSIPPDILHTSGKVWPLFHRAAGSLVRCPRRTLPLP